MMIKMDGNTDEAEKAVDEKCIVEGEGGAASASEAGGDNENRIGRTYRSSRKHYIDILELEDGVAFVKFADDITKGWLPEITYVPKNSNPGLTELLERGVAGVTEDEVLKLNDVVKPYVEEAYFTASATSESSTAPQEFSPNLNVDTQENLVEEKELQSSVLEKLLGVNQSSSLSLAIAPMEITSTSNQGSPSAPACDIVQGDDSDVADAVDVNSTGGNVSIEGSAEAPDSSLAPLFIMLKSEKDEQQESLISRNAAIFPDTLTETSASSSPKTAETYGICSEETRTCVLGDDWDEPAFTFKNSGPIPSMVIEATASKASNSSSSEQQQLKEKPEGRQRLSQEEWSRERAFGTSRRTSRMELTLGLRRAPLKTDDPWAPIQVLQLLTNKGYVLQERVFFVQCMGNGEVKMLEYDGRWVRDSVHIVELVLKLDPNGEAVAHGIAESDYKPFAFNAAAVQLIKSIRERESNLPDVQIPKVLQLKPSIYFDMLKVVARRTHKEAIVTDTFEIQHGRKWFLCEVQYPFEGKTRHIRRSGTTSLLARLAAAYDIICKFEPRRVLAIRESSSGLELAKQRLDCVLAICPDREYSSIHLGFVPMPTFSDNEASPPFKTDSTKAQQNKEPTSGTSFGLVKESSSPSDTVKLETSVVEAEDPEHAEGLSPPGTDNVCSNLEKLSSVKDATDSDNHDALIQLKAISSNLIDSSTIKNVIGYANSKLDAEAEIAEVFCGLEKKERSSEVQQDSSLLTSQSLGLLVDLTPPAQEDGLMDRDFAKLEDTVAFWMGIGGNQGIEECLSLETSSPSGPSTAESCIPEVTSDTLPSLCTIGTETPIFNTSSNASAASEESSSSVEILRQDQSLVLPDVKHPSFKPITVNAATQTDIIHDTETQTKHMRPHGLVAAEIQVPVVSTGTNTSFLDFEETEFLSAGAVVRYPMSSFAGDASREGFIGNNPADQFNTIIVMFFVALVMYRIAFWLWELFLLLLAHAVL